LYYQTLVDQTEDKQNASGFSHCVTNQSRAAENKKDKVYAYAVEQEALLGVRPL